MRYIKNEDLILDEIPMTLDEGDVSHFSHTFNGYEYGGSFKGCADVSKKVQTAINEKETELITLSELRACLFFYYRALRHGGEPDKSRVDNLLHLIRDRVQKKEFK